MNNGELNKEFLNFYTLDFKVNLLNDISKSLSINIDQIENIIVNKEAKNILYYLPEYKKNIYNELYNNFILEYITFLELKIKINKI